MTSVELHDPARALQIHAEPTMLEAREASQSSLLLKPDLLVCAIEHSTEQRSIDSVWCEDIPWLWTESPGANRARQLTEEDLGQPEHASCLYQSSKLSALVSLPGSIAALSMV